MIAMLPASRMYRPILVFLMLIMLALCFPQAAYAAKSAAPANAASVAFDVIAVKADQSVSIRTKAFPMRTKFTVRMAAVDQQPITGKPVDMAKLAQNGEIVGELESGQGGTLEATYPIPASLRGKVILALRVESSEHYLGAAWFFNETWTSPAANTQRKPTLAFSEVKKNSSVTVTARDLPANTPFSVRVGPFDSFYRNYTYTEDV